MVAKERHDPIRPPWQVLQPENWSSGRIFCIHHRIPDTIKSHSFLKLNPEYVDWDADCGSNENPVGKSDHMRSTTVGKYANQLLKASCASYAKRLVSCFVPMMQKWQTNRYFTLSRKLQNSYTYSDTKITVKQEQTATEVLLLRFFVVPPENEFYF